MRKRVLVMVPTDLERKSLEIDCGPEIVFATIGMGLSASGVGAAFSLKAQNPDLAILAGIAGSFDLGRAPLGTAHEFTKITCDGIGAGEGDAFLSPRRLGFPQWGRPEDGDAIWDRIELHSEGNELLSVAAASADSALADRRRTNHPLALAEDMEAFSVALACQRATVPLRVFRGISNSVGRREAKEWKIDLALEAVRNLLMGFVETL